jgi:hypothetical protein
MREMGSLRSVDSNNPQENSVWYVYSRWGLDRGVMCRIKLPIYV